MKMLRKQYDSDINYGRLINFEALVCLVTFDVLARLPNFSDSAVVAYYTWLIFELVIRILALELTLDVVYLR